MKPTLVLGATPKPYRFAYRAARRLKEAGHTVYPVGIRTGEIEGMPIMKGQPVVDNVDTITLYIGPDKQPQYYDYILSLKPKRIIFNPGTENPELIRLAKENGIEPEIACTLVMLSIDEY